MQPVLGSLLDILALRIRQEELSIMYHYNYYYTYLGIPLVCLIGIQSSLFYLLRKQGSASFRTPVVEDVKWKQTPLCRASAISWRLLSGSL